MKAAVKDVMTTRVIWVRKDASFKEMAAALRVPETPELGSDLIQRIWHAQGVVAVRDRLAYPPPDRDDVPLMSHLRFPAG